MKECWNCNLKTMFPSEDLGKGWWKCSDCGATWCDTLKGKKLKSKATGSYAPKSME